MIIERKTTSIPVVFASDDGSDAQKVMVGFTDKSAVKINGKGPEGTFTSAIFDDGEKLHFDEDARALGAQNPSRVIHQWKSKFGTSEKLLSGKHTAADLAAEFYKYKVRVAEAQLGTSLKGTHAVATRSHGVSDVGAVESQRAIEKAGLKFGAFIAEHTAAIYAHAISRGLTAGSTKKIVLGLLAGGFTFDPGIARVGGGAIDILAARSATNMSGAEIVRRLKEYVIKKAAKALGLASLDEQQYDPDTRYQLDIRSLRAVASLSLHEQVVFPISAPGSTKTRSITVTQAEYHTNVLDVLIPMHLKQIDEVMDEAKVSKADIHAVAPAGGPLRSPYLCQAYAKHLGLPVEVNPEGMWRVVEGALIFGFDEVGKRGAMKTFSMPKASLTDVLPATVGVMMHIDGGQKPLSVPLFEKSTPVPSEQMIRGRLLLPDQDAIDIQIVQMPRPYAPIEECKEIGRGRLSGLTPEEVMSDRFEIYGKTRAGGLIDVRVVDTATGLSTFITATMPPDQQSK